MKPSVERMVWTQTIHLRNIGAEPPSAMAGTLVLDFLLMESSAGSLCIVVLMASPR